MINCTVGPLVSRSQFALEQTADQLMLESLGKNPMVIRRPAEGPQTLDKGAREPLKLHDVFSVQVNQPATAGSSAEGLGAVAGVYQIGV